LSFDGINKMVMVGLENDGVVVALELLLPLDLHA